MYDESGMDFVVREEDTLQRLCLRMARPQADLADLMWGDVVLDRVSRCVELATARHGDDAVRVRNTVLCSLRWYMHKYVVAYRLRQPMQLNDEPIVAKAYTDGPSEVQQLWERLPEDVRGVVELRMLDGLTFEQIGSRLGMSRRAATILFTESVQAIQRAGCGDALSQTHRPVGARSDVRRAGRQPGVS